MLKHKLNVDTGNGDPPPKKPPTERQPTERQPTDEPQSPVKPA